MMRGYFGMGVERLSKPQNVGTLFRSAHAFGAQFVFAVAPCWQSAEDAAPTEAALAEDIGLSRTSGQVSERGLRASDTSRTADALPLFVWENVAGMMLPQGCSLVGVELTEESIELPSFRHPRRAAYVLGPERASLSPALQARCDHIVRIPTAFCINVAAAGVVVMYDRMISLGRFAERPVRSGGPTEPVPAHVHGRPIFRKADPNGA